MPHITEHAPKVSTWSVYPYARESLRKMIRQDRQTDNSIQFIHRKAYKSIVCPERQTDGRTGRQTHRRVVQNLFSRRFEGCTGWNWCIHGSVAGLPILRGRCKVVPYARVSLVAARSSPKRRYLPLVDNASIRHCALSAQFLGWTFVVRSPMEAMFHSFHHPLPVF